MTSLTPTETDVIAYYDRKIAEEIESAAQARMSGHEDRAKRHDERARQWRNIKAVVSA